MFELDNGSEPVDSHEPHSIREKILAYEAHQDEVLHWWHGAGRPRRHNPRFRVVFLTRTAVRAEHILALAHELARNKDRRLCYAATLDDVVCGEDALRQPIFLDHHGCWRPLLQSYPSSHVMWTPVRLRASE